ncbi:MAG: hypothetical protein ACLQVL_09860 [Terriglobia bacterium]
MRLVSTGGVGKSKTFREAGGGAGGWVSATDFNLDETVVNSPLQLQFGQHV